MSCSAVGVRPSYLKNARLRSGGDGVGWHPGDGDNEAARQGLHHAEGSRDLEREELAREWGQWAQREVTAPPARAVRSHCPIVRLSRPLPSGTLRALSP